MPPFTVPSLTDTCDRAGGPGRWARTAPQAYMTKQWLAKHSAAYCHLHITMGNRQWQGSNITRVMERRDGGPMLGLVTDLLTLSLSPCPWEMKTVTRFQGAHLGSHRDSWRRE